MKLQLIFFALVFYTFFVCSEPESQLQHIVPQNQRPTSLQIIIHNETQSGLDQNNALDQKPKHTSTPTTTVETTVEQRRNDLQTDEACDEKIRKAGMWTAAACAWPLSTLVYYFVKNIW